MYLIVGLGNKGDEYKDTNHNAGFRVVDGLASHYGAEFSKKQDCSSLVAFVKRANIEAIIAKPMTYMNNSGIAVKGLVKKYGINPSSELIIVSDDFDIKEGTIRIRKTSGASTHNGIRSIKSELSTNEFIRVKVSIAPRPEFMPIADFVLAKTKAENVKISEGRALNALISLLDGEDIDKVICNYSQ